MLDRLKRPFSLHARVISVMLVGVGGALLAPLRDKRLLLGYCCRFYASCLRLTERHMRLEEGNQLKRTNAMLQVPRSALGISHCRIANSCLG